MTAVSQGHWDTSRRSYIGRIHILSSKADILVRV